MLCFTLIHHQTHFRRLSLDSTESCNEIVLVNVVGVCKELDTFDENSAIPMHTGPPQNTLHDKIEEIA